MTSPESALAQLPWLEGRNIRGSVSSLRGLALHVRDLPLPVGTVVHVEAPPGPSARGEIVGFDGSTSIVMLLDENAAVRPGATVRADRLGGVVGVGLELIGRVVDAMGQPIDGGPGFASTVPRPIAPPPMGAMQRAPIVEPLATGIRCIDGLLTLGRGQRIGVFAGPGVGKSTLLSQIARNTSADVNVIALVGERGREVIDFLEHALGAEGRARSIVVASTGDESPVMRVRAALAATAIAEHFRDMGADVMLMMDSVTRLAQAQRQIGLTAGEPPATRGYPPSMFAMLPRLLERAGPVAGRGSITGIYTVLVEGDDLNEPVSDAVRGILDGHITLSRAMAGAGRYPAIDVLDSISRVADQVIDDAHRVARDRVRSMLAALAAKEELIGIGAYQSGSDPLVDLAREREPFIEDFLRQSSGDGSAYPETCRRMVEIAAGRTTAGARLQ
ncbi:MAG: FliI/YscN family ATPase [Phycisphaerales bacterium]